MSPPGEKIGTDRRNALRIWLKKHWSIRFAIAVSGAAITWWGEFHWFNHLSFLPGSTLGSLLWRTTPIFLVAALNFFFAIWALYLVFKGFDLLGKVVSTVLTVLLGIPFSVYISHALFTDWFGPAWNEPVQVFYWSAPIAAIFLLPIPFILLKRTADEAAMRGDYDRALRIGETWLRWNPFGIQYRGWVLLAAGRFSEAEALLRDAAFDSKGNPRLTDQQLFFYALAVVDQGRGEEVQPLLEAAIRVPQKTPLFHYYLADCLLSQKKDADRAYDLVEYALASLTKASEKRKRHGLIARCLALQAWARAVSGRREESEKRLRDAFAEYAAFSKHDRAALLQMQGQVFQALGDRQKAREALRNALEIFPFGNIAVLSRKRLAELGEDAAE